MRHRFKTLIFGGFYVSLPVLVTRASALVKGTGNCFIVKILLN